MRNYATYAATATDALNIALHLHSRLPSWILQGREPRRKLTVKLARTLSGNIGVSHEAAFDKAVNAISEASSELLSSLVTKASPKNRDIEAAKSRARYQAQAR